MSVKLLPETEDPCDSAKPRTRPSLYIRTGYPCGSVSTASPGCHEVRWTGRGLPVAHAPRPNGLNHLGGMSQSIPKNSSSTTSWRTGTPIPARNTRPGGRAIPPWMIPTKLRRDYHRSPSTGTGELAEINRPFGGSGQDREPLRPGSAPCLPAAIMFRPGGGRLITLYVSRDSASSARSLDLEQRA